MTAWPPGRAIHALVGACDPGDAELFFGPLDGTEEMVSLPDGARWPKLLVPAGIFRSSRECVGNGYGGPIPHGFAETVLGRKRGRVWIYTLRPYPITTAPSADPD